MTTTFDRVLASRPVNKRAAIVTSKGVDWQPNVNFNPHGRRWDAPPNELLQRPPGEDLAGRTLGRFTVIGYLGKLNPKKKAVWLCKCACGNYETRGRRAILAAASPKDACEHCRYLERVKDGRGNSPLAASDDAQIDAALPDPSAHQDWRGL